MNIELTFKEYVNLRIALDVAIRENQEIINLGLNESLYRNDVIESLKTIQDKLKLSRIHQMSVA